MPFKPKFTRSLNLTENGARYKYNRESLITDLRASDLLARSQTCLNCGSSVVEALFSRSVDGGVGWRCRERKIDESLFA